MKQDVIDAICSLRDAKTIREIFEIDLPKAVWVMPHAEKFREMFLALDLEDPRLTSNASKLIVQGDGSYKWLRDGVPDAFKGLQDKVLEAEAAANDGRIKEGTSIIFKAGINRHEITALHADYTRTPNSRMYLFRTDTPTLCLSHKDQLDVVSKNMCDQTLLDKPILNDDCNTKDLFNLLSKHVKYTAYGRALNGQIPAKLHPLEAGALTVMSGASFHQKQDVISKGPVFHAVVHDCSL